MSSRREISILNTQAQFVRSRLNSNKRKIRQSKCLAIEKPDVRSLYFRHRKKSLAKL
jgi:hypothetical protein